MGAFFDGTLIGLHRTLRDGRDNLARQGRELAGRDDEYAADLQRCIRLFDAAIAALPPPPGEQQGAGGPARAGDHPQPPAAPGRRRAARSA